MTSTKILMCLALLVLATSQTAGAQSPPLPPSGLPGSALASSRANTLSKAGRAWTYQPIGTQEEGAWGPAIAAPKGMFIDTWKVGTAAIGGLVGGKSFNFNGTVSIQGRLNNGTWLPAAGGTVTVAPGNYQYFSQENGWTSLFGRAGGWVTQFLFAGQTPDDVWALDGLNAGLTIPSKVVGYQLKTFEFIGDAAFLYDSTF